METYIYNQNNIGIMDIGDLELTEEELSKVNTIISSIQSDLDLAISLLNKNDFEGAINAVDSGISKSTCPLCKRELGTLKADIVHNKEICILKSDSCEEEHKLVINKAHELKEDFIPIKTKKKALIEKKKQIKESNIELETPRNIFILPRLPPIHLFRSIK